MNEYKQVYHSAICDSCDESIVGIRYTCVNCADFDVCEDCFENHHCFSSEKKEQLVESTHNCLTHSFLKCYAPIKRKKDLSCLPFDKAFVSSPDEKLVDLKENILHEYIVCDGCNTVIFGRRFSCFYCDFDFCSKCEEKTKVHKKLHCFVISPYGKQLIEPPKVKFEKKNIIFLDAKRVVLEPIKYKKNKNSKKIFLPKEYIIREAKLIDLDKVVKIEEASFSFPYSFDQFYHMLIHSKKKKIANFVLEINGRVAGYYNSQIKRSKETGKLYVTILSIAVSPNFRRMGVANALIKHIIDTTKKKKVKCIVLKVSVHNKPAQNLYSKFGFKVEEWCVEYYHYFKQEKLTQYKKGDYPGDALKMKLTLK